MTFKPMADSKQPETKSVGPTQLNLVNSSRLQALCKQSVAAGSNEAPPAASPVLAGSNAKENAETAQLRREVDQRLREILARLPAGKQRSLFKIRYGVALDELEQMLVSQVAAILDIRPAKRR